MNRWRIKRLYRRADRSWKAGYRDGVYGGDDSALSLPSLEIACKLAYRAGLSAGKAKSGYGDLPRDVWAEVLAEALRPPGYHR